MSRHKNIRNRTFSDEMGDEMYEEEDDFSPMSPTGESFMYRAGEHKMDLGNFLGGGGRSAPASRPTEADVDIELVGRVRVVVGAARSETAIRRALLNNGMDPDAAVSDLLIEGPSTAAPGVYAPPLGRAVSASSLRPADEGPSTAAPGVYAPPLGRAVSASAASIASTASKGAATASAAPRGSPTGSRTSTPSKAPSRASAASPASGTGAGAGAGAATPASVPLARATSKPAWEGHKMRTDKAQRKAEALLEEEEAKDKAAGKDRLNLVVVGHVDAGKSTLMGHLLLKLGQVSDRAMHKFQKEAREAGKASFAFAWVLDEHAEERSRGVTIDVAVNEFETERRAVTLLDAPGHRDFIPNMITGAAQADAAVLVVPATTNEFETAFQEGGQTREHAVLVRSLGVAQMVVAVNKMDTVDWSRARFEEIVAQVGPFLHSCGFRPDRLSFVPVSGLTGDNLASRGPAALSAWHSGACLAEAIDTFQPAVRPVRKPLRAVVSDVFRSSSMGHATVGCKVET
eukprot:CAMPEP_0196799166 /NCGR_PEP_ID=MMETSP1104-20130614/39504_1 /TAXON_ID=33652 /ORGANISM="Cafeteria sp., Strain Caron Lab Isolate" /LENGTH=515 /DNA_ID=CAMNT_0042169575 /DNA_START=1 /DNA_END=1545 /DNA_ORIENTATION=-